MPVGETVAVDQSRVPGDRSGGSKAEPRSRPPFKTGGSLGGGNGDAARRFPPKSTSFEGRRAEESLTSLN